jgi:hypothetical protein
VSLYFTLVGGDGGGKITASTAELISLAGFAGGSFLQDTVINPKNNTLNNTLLGVQQQQQHQHPHHQHHHHQQQQQQPHLINPHQRQFSVNTEAPLPLGWDVAKTSNGQRYFIK